MSDAPLALIHPDDPPLFPDVEQALIDPDGLLAIGGDLSPARLLAAYRHGIFPWYSKDEPILWWAPNPRAVLLPDEFSCSKSLAKTIRKDKFEVSVNQRFDEVIEHCATLRLESGTWITNEMLAAYKQLHELGHAHSVETWHEGELAGGLYGIRIGSVFFGESMFSLKPDASKVALAQLVRLCDDSGIPLIDCQQPSAHLSRLGSRLIKRHKFTALLQENTSLEPLLADWTQPRAPSNTSINNRENA
jgi:leucyl/phenylalanyl-tRNA--protein transferase